MHGATLDPKISVTADTAPTTLSNRYPGTFPFADTELDRTRFRGRDEEVRSLFHQLLSAGLLVFFAKPGLGKTSLLNARLFHLLRQHDFLPLPVRFNQPNLTPPVTPIFLAAFERTCRLETIDYTPGEDRSLWEFFKTAVFWRGNRLQIPVLVLDQFEEIFEQTPEFRRALAAELGQLTSGSLPDHIRQQAQLEEALPFSEKAPDVKILISLREDELGLLEELTSEIPGILQNRFRLTGLSTEDARSAVVEPALIEPKDVEFATRPFAYQEDAIEQIIAAATTFEAMIDPFFLQLLCSNVEKQVRDKQRANGEAIEVDTGYFGGDKGVKALTAEFYHNAIRALPDWGLQKRARRMCEEELVTVDGRRRSVPLDDLKHNFKVTGQSLELLENARLLRSEPKLGTSYYEVSHDRLAEAIRDSRPWRMPLKGWIIVSAVGTVILGIILGIFSYQQHARLESEHKLRLTAATARDQAATARDQAAAARAQAESVLNFLIYDVRGKLKPIGQFDLIENIQKNVERHYEKMGPEGVPDDVMREREVFVFNNGGDLRRIQGDLEAAMVSYDKGMQISTKLAGNDPSNMERQRDLSTSYDNIGYVQSAQGDLKAAMESYRKSMQIREKLAGKQPSDMRLQRDLSTSYDNIGYMRSAQGDLKAAMESYRKSMQIREKLAGKQPSDMRLQRDLSTSYDNIGYVQSAQGDLKAAMESYRKGMEINTKFAGNESNRDWQRDLSIRYNRIGDVQRAQGDLGGAMESYLTALEILKNLEALDAENTTWKVDLAYSHWEMAYLLGILPNPDKQQSESECDSALEILWPLDSKHRLAAAEAGWVRDIETNKQPHRNPSSQADKTIY